MQGLEMRSDVEVPAVPAASEAQICRGLTSKYRACLWHAIKRYLCCWSSQCSIAPYITSLIELSDQNLGKYSAKRDFVARV